LAISPVRLLENAPIPEPSVVLVLAVVGLEVVFQQTPRAVTAAPPSDEMLPPLVAVVLVIEDAAVVVRVGTTGAIALAVKLT